MPVLGIIGDIVGGIGSIPIGGGRPLTRFGMHLASLAAARGRSDADRWARDREKTIDDGEQELARDGLAWWLVPGSRPGIKAAQELWATRIISYVSELGTPLTASEWEGFRATDRGRDCLEAGLIPPAGAVRSPVRGGAAPPSSPGGSPVPAGLTLPEQLVTGPNLFPLVAGAALAFLLLSGRRS